MEKIKQKLSNLKKSIKEFHTKKPQLEFFTALLSVPVLLTVIILNLNSLRGLNKNNATPTPVVISQSKEKEVIVTKEACKPGIGDISIVNPGEGENVADNPVTVDIKYVPGDFCSVVWSYRINGGRWSDYDDRSIALYNLSNGNIKLELRVKSLVNSDNRTLGRNFVYSGASSATPTPSPTPTAAQ